MCNCNYTFAGLSGVEADASDPNPYNALIKACPDDADQITKRYQGHRLTRATQQRGILNSPDFSGVNIDPVLRRIHDEEARGEDEKTGYQDPRHCAVIWARPHSRIKQLVGECQRRLNEVIPHAYFQPLPDLHITVMEVAHSLSEEQLSSLLESIPSSVIKALVNLPPDTAQPNASRTRGFAQLGRPMLTYDANALALSFLPLDGTYLQDHSDSYTYHHLRRDAWALLNDIGVPIASRYIVPSSHLTIARFVDSRDTSTNGQSDPKKMQRLVRKIDEINAWLENEYGAGGKEKENGEWMVGEEQGLIFRTGRLWYGGGETIESGPAILPEDYF